MTKVRKIGLQSGLAFMITGVTLCGQNLVPDPGFEKLDHCPDKGFKNQSTLKALSYWWCPNKTSPDCMSRCAGGMDGIMNNVGGSQDPYEGDSYAGICHGRKGKYYEFVQTQLTSSLESGKTYLITFHVSFGDKVFYATNEMGVSLSREKITSKGKEAPGDGSYIAIRNGTYYTDKQKWIKLRALYQAEGGEEYLTIGFFNPWPELQLVGGKKPTAIDGEADDVYYYMDDVSVEEWDMNGADMILFDTAVVGKTLKYKKEKWFGFSQLEFATGKNLLLPGGHKYLDQLAGVMIADSSLKLNIAYRYAPETEEQRKLVHSREKLIRNYIIGKGVRPERILFINERSLGSHELGQEGPGFLLHH